jgi:RNA polymerase sigma-B factor
MATERFRRKGSHVPRSAPPSSRPSGPSGTWAKVAALRRWKSSRAEGPDEPREDRPASPFETPDEPRDDRPASPFETLAGGSAPDPFQRGERRLLAAYQFEGDLGARDELMRRLLPLAEGVARRYQHGSESLEDLVQVASVGAMKAIERFDMTRHTTLASYAMPIMAGEIRHHLRDNVGPVYVPRAMHARARKVAGIAGDLATRLRRPPSAEEIAKSAGLEPDEVLDALEAWAAGAPRSLEAFATDDDGETLSYLEVLGSEDSRYDAVEIRAALEGAWRSLDPRARIGLYLRYVEERTFDEVGDRLGLSPTQASRLVGAALARLRFVARLREVVPGDGAGPNGSGRPQGDPA